jgi:hypothetical protein
MKAPDPKVHEVIFKAIDEIRLLRFVFGGKERIVEPHDYGIHKGLVRLFSYQIGGQSTTGPLPAWRLMEVAKMSEVEILDQTFPGSRGDASQQHRQWDRVFARVGKRNS